MGDSTVRDTALTVEFDSMGMAHGIPGALHPHPAPRPGAAPGSGAASWSCALRLHTLHRLHASPSKVVIVIKSLTRLI